MFKHGKNKPFEALVVNKAGHLEVSPKGITTRQTVKLSKIN